MRGRAEGRRELEGFLWIYQVGALPAGTYFVRVSAPGFAGALFDGLPCAGGCDVTSGNPVKIRVNEETSRIDFVLEPAVLSFGG